MPTVRTSWILAIAAAVPVVCGTVGIVAFFSPHPADWAVRFLTGLLFCPISIVVVEVRACRVLVAGYLKTPFRRIVLAIAIFLLTWPPAALLTVMLLRIVTTLRSSESEGGTQAWGFLLIVASWALMVGGYVVACVSLAIAHRLQRANVTRSRDARRG